MKKEIRNHLKQKLPTYMIPNYFKRIESIPITNNGKLNRKALPEPDMNDFIKEEYVEPKTDVEKLICKIYSNVFKFQDNEIGILDDFFELGGDSLNAIRVSSMIEQELKIKINIKDILNHTVIKDLSEYIEDKMQNKDSNDILINNLEIFNNKSTQKEFPMTSQQLGVYIDSMKYPNNIMYNIPTAFKLRKNVSESDIEKIKKELMKYSENMIF
ncbi:hypothetical protein PIROE2DRAFT_19047 [Piromyces sp. E2]|nr:hypothetical protein PIROE2DRAFT_19047 [Piromyces sp. E2]|eukprot:OUM56367.1 hypothetical protein PIROE2DRAFT_19047 [Piromyces sp. E2]